MINNGLMELFDISFEELDEAAVANTEKMQKFSVKSMRQVIAEMMRMPEELIDETPMHVVRGEDGLYSASVMLYPKYFKELADKLEDDLVILPSSVHEVLALPFSYISKEDARKMVEEVNESELSDEEFLSNNVYKYSRETGKVELL